MPLLKSFYTEREIEAGCDEAGRGCLAGPVFAAAVVLSRDFAHPLLNDSKLVSEENRTLLRTYIEERALAFCVARVDEEEIDRINILKASFKAMHLAIDGLGLRPGHLLIDGNRFIKYQNLAHTCIIKGDSQYASIAAASILAKTYRDEYMLQLHESFPHYGWRNNKGYGTAEHRRAIGRYGLCRHHRKTFQCRDTQLSIELE